MSDPKPFASLSSGLLARKGAARPAMRPQGFSPSSASLEDLGWNDMGHEPGHDHAGLTPLAPTDHGVEHPRGAALGLSPVTSPVHSQQAQLAQRLASGDEDYDEEYDETAEPYEPEGGAKFNGFDTDEEGETEEEAGEPEFRVQFKGGKKPLDLGPSPAAEPQPVAEPEEDVLDLVEAVTPAPQPVEASEPLLLDKPVIETLRAPATKTKAAFTLRLDPDRHLKLRLACAVRGGSAQQLVTDALDRLLQSMPELEELADKVRQRN